MSTKQLLTTALLLAVSVSTANAGYPEIECSTDSVFAANNCHQCFDGGQREVGENIANIDDLWKNVSDNQKIMFEQDQSDPRMQSLGGSQWRQVPDSEDFWERPDVLKNLYSDQDEGYILEPGLSVKFIKSAIDSAYRLESTEASQGENAGLLIFPLLTHTVLEGGDYSTDDEVHNECVLYKAAGETTPSEPGTPTKEPEPKKMTQVETGAEAYLILLFALILGFVYIKTRKQA